MYVVIDDRSRRYVRQRWLHPEETDAPGRSTWSQSGRRVQVWLADRRETET